MPPLCGIGCGQSSVLDGVDVVPVAVVEPLEYVSPSFGFQ